MLLADRRAFWQDPNLKASPKLPCSNPRLVPQCEGFVFGALKIFVLPCRAVPCFAVDTAGVVESSSWVHISRGETGVRPHYVDCSSTCSG